MKLLCDEGIEVQIVEALRSDGHEVEYVAAFSPSISDEEVLALSRVEEALLVTQDKDFGELVYRQGKAYHGVLLVRLHGLEAEEKGRLTVTAMREHGEELVSAFSVIEKNRLRIRRKPS